MAKKYESALHWWFDRECELYRNKEMSIETKAVIAWELLRTARKTGCINSDTQYDLFGRFMHQAMEIN